MKMMGSPQLFPQNDFVMRIIKSFRDGKPLSAQQLHFLRQNQVRVSTPTLDPIMQYYHIYKRPSSSFLLPQSHLDQSLMQRFKRQLEVDLETMGRGIEVEFTLEQYNQLRKFIIGEPYLQIGEPVLHQGLPSVHPGEHFQFFNMPSLHRGNPHFELGMPYLDPEMPYLHQGMPLLPSGAPHLDLDFFQWENLYGIVLETNNFTARVKVYFDQLKNRLLYIAVQDYLRKQQQQQQLQLQKVAVPSQIIQLANSFTPTPAPPRLIMR